MATNSENDALILDVWQKIPPEEKVKLTSEAQATAISTVAIFCMFGWAVAVGFKEPWYLWGSFCVVPFLFQVFSKKAWQIVRPRAIVEYTAARATATHYAAEAGGRELYPSLQFKGTLEQDSSDPSQGDSDSADGTLEGRGPVPVWVTVFPDSVVLFSESARGARPELACSIYEDLSVATEGFDEEALDQRKLLFSLRQQDGSEYRWVLRSGHTSQLTACERRLQSAIDQRNAFLADSPQSPQKAMKNDIRTALGG